MRSCVIRSASLFGPLACGCDGIIYDRARKGWLCRNHTKERLCEFCQAQHAWGRCCYLKEGIASEAWLCMECAGWSVRNQKT